MALYSWPILFIQSKRHFIFWHDTLGLMHKEAAGIGLQEWLTEQSPVLHFMVIERTERNFITINLPYGTEFLTPKIK